MLTKCADGWAFKKTDHFYKLTYKTFTYPSFPKHDKIDAGHVKRMVRLFGIKECAEKEIPQLK